MIDSKENILIKVYDDNNKIVERKMEELIPEMVAAQIDIDFEFEAIKVQTIIARTLLIRKSKYFGGEGCTSHTEADICLREHCTKWISKEELQEKWKDRFDLRWKTLLRAQRETDKLIITFNNKVIDPKFHCTCGGSTDNSENINNQKIIYLRRVLCDYCKDSPYWSNFQDLSIQEIQDKLNIKINKNTPFYGSDTEGIIEELERDEEGRVIKIKIGDKIFRGTEIKEELGLDSTSGKSPWEYYVEIKK